MNKLIGYLILFVSISIVSFAAPTQPKFVIVGGDEYDWGKVKPKDSPLNASIIFKNEGNADLVILKTKAGCGCTIPKLEKDTLLPGDTTVMNVKLNISGNGLFQKTIDIETNDPERKLIKYKLKCDIVRDIIFKPGEYMAFRGENAVLGKELTETVTIKNNFNRNIKFSDLKIEPLDVVKLTVPSDFTMKPGEEVTVTARHTPIKEGPVHAKITWKTDHPDYPTVTINVHGHINPNPILNESPPKK